MAAELNEQTGRYEATIEGRAFEFEMWAASQSLRVLLEISGLVGMPLAALKAADQNSGVFADIGKHLLANGDAGIKLVKKLTSVDGGVLCDHKPVKFDEFYRGSLGLMFHVAQSNFSLQFGSLADAAAKMGLSLPAPAAATSSHASTSETSA